MWQVFWRSFARAAFQRTLWNGNREYFSTWLRDDHPIRWAWSTYAGRRERFTAQMTDKWIRLQSRGAATKWLVSLPENNVSDR